MFEYRSLFDRRDPLGWEDLFRGFDQIVREFDRDLPLTSFGSAPAELTEEDGRFVLKVEVPGVPEKDIHVDLNQGVLTVSAERKVEAPAGYNVRRRERSDMRFSRSYALGDRVDPEQTTAEVKDGVLTVSLAKSTKAQKKSITVKAS
jgi:HSP20 family protein